MVRPGLKQSGPSLVLNTRTPSSARAEPTTQHEPTVKLGDGGKISGETIARLYANWIASVVYLSIFDKKNADSLKTRSIS